jgi:hypothetical protein
VAPLAGRVTSRGFFQLNPSRENGFVYGPAALTVKPALAVIALSGGGLKPPSEFSMAPIRRAQAAQRDRAMIMREGSDRRRRCKDHIIFHEHNKICSSNRIRASLAFSHSRWCAVTPRMACAKGADLSFGKGFELASCIESQLRVTEDYRRNKKNWRNSSAASLSRIPP